jgi:hypothetical protein
MEENLEKFYPFFSNGSHYNLVIIRVLFRNYCSNFYVPFLK